MKTLKIKIQGLTPIMHHRMTEEAVQTLIGVSKSEKKKDKEIKTPREIAQEHAYKVGGKFVIPSGYVVGAFKHAASDYKQKNSIRKSMKSIAAGAFVPCDAFIELKTKEGDQIKDFEVDIQKATNHKAGAVIVCRPRFDDWAAEFNVEIDDDLISEEKAIEILNDAGRRAGIGSFRVCKGGVYGKFIVKSFEQIVE